MKRDPDFSARMTQAGLLAWILPGAGHFFLGQRGMAAVFFVSISFAYWAGVAVGGVKGSVNPRENKWLFIAEMGVGGYTTGCFLISQSLGNVPAAESLQYSSFYPESDVAQIYLAVAGLLNVLAILDALARAQAGGLPVLHRELTSPGKAPPEGDS